MIFNSLFHSMAKQTSSPVFYMETSAFGNQFYAWKDRQAAPVVSNLKLKHEGV